ncbi:MAG: GDP-mannose 4,6-dehydratase, partial [Candidatus Binatia bacterium]
WFILAGLSGRPVTIYGNGKQVRDVLFVDDLLEAYRKAACRIERVSGKIFNIGGGRHRQISILQLLDTLREQFGITVHTTFSDWRAGDQKLFVSDISKAQRELQWHPKTEIRAGLQSTIEWLRGEGLAAALCPDGAGYQKPAYGWS